MKQKIKDQLKNKTAAELEKMIKKQANELVGLKMNLRFGKVKNHHIFSEARQQLARLKTILTIKKIKN